MFPPIRKAIIEGLNKVFNDNRYSDAALESLTKTNRKLGSRDRRSIAENLYGIVRHFRRLCKVAGVKYPKAHYSPEDFDAVMSTFEKSNSGKDIQRGNMTGPDWFSVSDDFYKTLVDELGVEKAEKYITEMNVQAPVFFRANLLLTDRNKLKQKFLAEDVKVSDVGGSDIALKLLERKNVFTLESFTSGLFEVQDIGSQEISQALSPEPGDRIVDACAGAGGKTLHLAALMKNKGKILALDTLDKKLDELKKRARRAKVDIVETRVIDSNKVIKRLKDTADRLLLDVPCTGSGVLKRNPDTKLRFSVAELERLKLIQTEILIDYSMMVKPGGVMVYSTCSILPSENEKQIEKFLDANKSTWRLDMQKTIEPTAELSDGFYICRLVRQA